MFGLDGKIAATHLLQRISVWLLDLMCFSIVSIRYKRAYHLIENKNNLFP